MKSNFYEKVEVSVYEINELVELPSILEKHILKLNSSKFKILNLLLDFKNIRFITSNALIKIYHIHKFNNLNIGLINVNKSIKYLFKLTNFIKFFNIFASEIEAKEYCLFMETGECNSPISFQGIFYLFELHFIAQTAFKHKLYYVTELV
jgi:anti-anti-sigma regulatory factor